MRRIRAALCATALVAMAAPVALTAPATADPSVQHAERRPRATRDLPPVAAIAADAVVDGFGVGIHLNFLDTPYRDADAVATALRQLGARHVRDDLYLDAPRQYAAIERVADRAGVRFDLIMGRPGGAATPQDYVDTVAEELPAGVVESLEGVNEWDHFGPDDAATWVPQLVSWQRQLFEAARAEPATAHLPVLSPALAFRWNYAELGDLSAHADLANAHMYPGGYVPSNEITRITEALLGVVRGRPVVTTEAGYHNALNTTHGHRPVPEDVAGVYLPRLLLEHLRRGERRVYVYELIDSFADPGLTNPEAHFGLLRHDLSPKPAYTAMQRLLALLADPGRAIAPGTLDVAVDGYPSDARHLLTQKRDGSFVLLLWREAAVWDPARQQRVEVAPRPVTLQLEQAADLTVHRPSSGAAPVGRTSGTSLPLSLDGQVTAVTIDPADAEPPPVAVPAPVEVAAVRGDGSATVSWRLPDSAAVVTGFEVTRQPDGGSQRVTADRRSLVDEGLVNGRRYTYEVVTLTADGRSAAARSAEVVPAGVPGAPQILAARTGHRRVVLTLGPADAHGSAVTAYEVQAGRRTVIADPQLRADGRLRVRVTGLPARARLRVSVRALNDVGWGVAAVTRVATTR